MLAILIIPAAAASTYRQQIAVEYGITLDINGQQAVLKDPNGNTVQPFVYNGTTYVPIRAVSDNLGATVEYDKSTNTASVMLAGTGNDLQLFDLLFRINDYLSDVLLTINRLNLSSFSTSETSENIQNNKTLVTVLDNYANMQLVSYLSYFEYGSEDYINAETLVNACRAISDDLNEFGTYYSNFMSIPTQYSSEAMTALEQKITSQVNDLQDIVLNAVSTLEEYLK